MESITVPCDVCNPNLDKGNYKKRLKSDRLVLQNGILIKTRFGICGIETPQKSFIAL